MRSSTAGKDARAARAQTYAGLGNIFYELLLIQVKLRVGQDEIHFFTSPGHRCLRAWSGSKTTKRACTRAKKRALVRAIYFPLSTKTNKTNMTLCPMLLHSITAFTPEFEANFEIRS